MSDTEIFQHVATKDQFEEVLSKAGDKPVFVDFYATWCGKCEMLKPDLEDIAKSYLDKAYFIKVDVEENEEVADEYKVETLPTVMLIKNKERAGDMTGSKVENFKKFMTDNLQ
jgi:thioredoxin 1